VRPMLMVGQTGAIVRVVDESMVTAGVIWMSEVPMKRAVVGEILPTTGRKFTEFP